jgi:riboflavin synthase
MFTGLVEETGIVARVESGADGTHIDVRARTVLEGLAVGDSISIDGVCQTVVRHDADSFAVHAMATTLSRTTFAMLRAGTEVNLERALALGARLGGHLVQGHVDAVGTVARVDPREGHVLLDVEAPEEVLEATVLHGSIAINGVSLTVNALHGAVIQVALIPHTWQHTNLRLLRAGQGVNLEADLFGKYVISYMKRVAARGV